MASWLAGWPGQRGQGLFSDPSWGEQVMPLGKTPRKNSKDDGEGQEFSTRGLVESEVH